MPSMDFHVDQNGQTQTVDDQHIVNQLKGMGYDVAGVSADGMTLTFNEQGPKGQTSQYQVKTPDVLKTMGFGLKGMTPSNPDTENIDSGLSAMLHALPADDDAKRSYIEAKLRHRGIENPQVTGMGNEWHVFNPHTSQWVQVTQEPGMNMAGLYSAGLEIPHLAGSALGGAVGGVVGAAGGPVGGVAGLAAGAGLGGAGGQALEQAALEHFDPDYEQAIRSQSGHPIANVLKTGGLDALAMGLAKPLAGLSPLSRSLQVGGKALEGIGELGANAAGKIAESPTASTIVSDFAPYIGNVTGAGQFMQIPSQAVKGAAKLAAGASENQYLAPLLGEENAARLSDLGSSLLQKRANGTLGEKVASGAQRVAESFGAPASEEVTARDILGNLSARRGAAANYASHASEEQAARDAGREWAASMGLSEQEGEMLASHMGDEYRNSMMKILQAQQPSSNLGTRTGRALESLYRAGKGLEQAGVQTTRAGLRGIQGLGRMSQGAGMGLNAIGTVTRPLEMPLYLRYGLPKLYDESQRNP